MEALTAQAGIIAAAVLLNAAAHVAAAVAEEHISMSVANSIAFEAAPVDGVALPNDHTVLLSQAARRGDQILYFTSLIRQGHRFLIALPPRSSR